MATNAPAGKRARVEGNAPWPLITAYGLFVEHYQKYEVIWNGENGKTIFFQNEMPYDVPSQEIGRAHV